MRPWVESLLAKRPPDTEADVVGPELGGDAAAEREADVVVKAVPGTAAQHTFRAVTSSPYRAIRRRTRIAVLVSILGPFQLIPIPPSVLCLESSQYLFRLTLFCLLRHLHVAPYVG